MKVSGKEGVQGEENPFFKGGFLPLQANKWS